MNNVFELAEALLSVSSRNEKMSIIRECYDNKYILELLKIIFDDRLVFNISEQSISASKYSKELEFMFSDIKSLLLYLSESDTGTTDEKAKIVSSFVYSHEEAFEREQLRDIICKRTTWGISSSTINKALGYELIPVFQVALAQPFAEERIKANMVIVEPKLDGVRVLIKYTENGVALFTRNGKQIFGFSTIEKELVSIFESLDKKYKECNSSKDIVIDGELMVDDGFKSTMESLFRESSGKEGKINVFDITSSQVLVGTSCGHTIQDRKLLIEHIFQKEYSSIKKVDYRIVNTESLYEYLDKFTEMGFEGVMVKTLGSFYSPKRTYDWMKLKKTKDITARIVSIEKGSGMLRDTVGALIVSYKIGDNEYSCRVGTGLTLEDRYYMNNNDVVGKLVDIRYQEFTNDFKLRFPSYKGMRNDL